MADIQVCSRCYVDKELSEYNKDQKRANGLTAMCKNCITVHHSRSNKIAQFVLDRHFLIWSGEVFPEINTENKAFEFSKSKNIKLDIVKQISKLFNE